MFSYTLTNQQLEISRILVRRAASANLIRRSVALINELNRFTSDDLEIMSSLVYLKLSDEGIDDSSLVQLTRSLKPRFSTEKIKSKLSIFRILRSNNILIAN